MPKLKKWTRPKLIIFVKGRPEERILQACKGGTIAGDIDDTHGHCDTVTTHCPAGCEDLAVS